MYISIRKKGRTKTVEIIIIWIERKTINETKKNKEEICLDFIKRAN